MILTEAEMFCQSKGYLVLTGHIHGDYVSISLLTLSMQHQDICLD